MPKPEAKKYNTTVAPLWKSTTGRSLNSRVLDDAALQEIQGALNTLTTGAKLMIKFVKEESRFKDTSPHAYLEIVSADDVAAFEAKRKANNNTQADVGL